MKAKHMTQRESLGKKLALMMNGGNWETDYNAEQREVWYKRADELLEHMKRNGWLT